MANHPLKDTAEIEITCPHCGHRTMRTAARLRRKTKVLCPFCGKAIARSEDARDPNQSHERNDE